MGGGGGAPWSIQIPKCVLKVSFEWAEFSGRNNLAIYNQTCYNISLTSVFQSKLVFVDICTHEDEQPQFAVANT